MSLPSFRDSSFARVWRLLRPELAGHVGAVALVFVLAAITAAGEKAPLFLLKPLMSVLFYEDPAAHSSPSSTFDRVFSSATEHIARWTGAGAATPEQARIDVLVTIAVLIFAAALVTAAAEYAFVWLTRWISLRMVIGLRMRLARHLVRLSMRYHGERRFGDLLSRVSSDVTITLGAVQTALKELVQQPFMVLGSLVLAFAVSPTLTLVVVLFLPLIALPIGMLGRKVRRRSTKSLASLGASVEALTQIFRGIRTVKAFRAEERELARYAEINRDYLKTSMRMARAVSTIEASTTLLSHLGFALLLVGAGWLTISRRGFDSAGDMMVFFTAIATTYANLKRASITVNRVQESAGAADRLQSLLEQRADIEERPGAITLAGLGSGVAFERVTFSYPGTHAPALVDLSLEVRPGETLALVGPSGAGKTTLVDLIARFIEPSSGRVLADGRDLRDLTLDSWTRQFAMVGQVPFLFHSTVLDNIRYGRPDATPQEVEAAARAANIHEFIASLPEGYATVVGDAGSRLSGGQRQRITIARAILKGAPLLLLDEATSALDSESEAAVQEALERLMQGRTVIVIAHRLSTVRRADRIAVLDAGRLVELGTHAELLARGGTYARLHAVQFPSGSEVSV